MSLLFIPLAGYGGTVDPRPVAGKGVVILPAMSSPDKLALFELPGIRSSRMIDPTALPTLAPFVAVKSGETALGVMSSREGWLKIITTVSGREAWVMKKETWNFQPWERYLVGRTIRFVRGLKEMNYRIRSTPFIRGAPTGTITQGVPLPVRTVNDDWIEVMMAGGNTGWLRWRDGDGRMLVTVE